MAGLLRNAHLDSYQRSFLRRAGHIFYRNIAQKTDLSPMETLAQKILSYGGVVFLVPESGEPDLVRMLGRGEVFDCENPLIVKGQSNRGHNNSAWYWSGHDDKVEIVTGYGLSDDGIWRQHTWCRKIKGGRIVETTVPRVLYFGVRLTYKESEGFFKVQF